MELCTGMRLIYVRSIAYHWSKRAQNVYYSVPDKGRRRYVIDIQHRLLPEYFHLSISRPYRRTSGERKSPVKLHQQSE